MNSKNEKMDDVQGHFAYALLTADEQGQPVEALLEAVKQGVDIEVLQNGTEVVLSWMPRFDNLLRI